MTIEQFNQTYGKDPQFLQLVQAADAEAHGSEYPGALSAMGPAGTALRQFEQSKGLDVHNTQVRPSASGGFEIYDTHPGREFAKDAAISAGIAGGGALLAGALAPAAAAGTAGAATGGAGTAAATTAATAAGGGSLLHSLLPTIIGAGASLGGTAIAANANSEAAKIAAAQADKALAVQQQQYALQRQDTAPYRALGQGAVNNLGFLSGIDTTSNLKALSDINPTVNPPPSTGVAPGAVDASGKPIPGAPPTSSITPPTMAQQQTNNKTLSQVGGGGTVRIQDPATGMVHLIPQSDAAAAQQAGGRLV